MSKFMTVAKRAASAAAKVTLKHYGSNLKVMLKPNRTPVTVADREAEKTIVRTIRAAFPDHGFYGEEFGAHGTEKQKSDYTWIIDPIDGTKNFIAGIPLWGTLIALRHKEQIILGLSHIPRMNELLWAERGHGAFLNGKRVHVSDNSRLSTSMVSYGSLPAFKEISKEKSLLSLIKASKRQRSFGDCWPYHLLACGKLELVVEAKIKLVDVAPFDLIIREAGGNASDIHGNEIGLNPVTFLATNGRVHNQALQIFSGRN